MDKLLQPRSSAGVAAEATMARSRYDDLNDKYHALLSTKAGTRYERLAAIVFKVDRSWHLALGAGAR
jgi:hypothetical protein